MASYFSRQAKHDHKLSPDLVRVASKCDDKRRFDGLMRIGPRRDSRKDTVSRCEDFIEVIEPPLLSVAIASTRRALVGRCLRDPAGICSCVGDLLTCAL